VGCGVEVYFDLGSVYIPPRKNVFRCQKQTNILDGQVQQVLCQPKIDPKSIQIKLDDVSVKKLLLLFNKLVFTQK